MELGAVCGKLAVSDRAESAKGGQGASEGNFLDFAAQMVRDGRISSAKDVGSGEIGFNRAKFSFDKNLTLDEAKEEEIKGFLKKIQSVLKDKSK